MDPNLFDRLCAYAFVTFLVLMTGVVAAGLAIGIGRWWLS